MKHLPKWLVSIWMISLLSSCSWLSQQVSPDCLGYRPDEADVTFLLSHDAVNDTVLVVIYNGDMDDNLVVDSFDAWSETLTVTLPVDQYYSAKAFYTVDNQEYIAVDGDELKAMNNPDDYGDCWLISGDKLYLQIMYP